MWSPTQYHGHQGAARPYKPVSWASTCPPLPNELSVTSSWSTQSFPPSSVDGELSRWTNRGYIMNDGVLYRYSRGSRWTAIGGAGHSGVERTLAKISQKYQWWTMCSNGVSAVQMQQPQTCTLAKDAGHGSLSLSRFWRWNFCENNFVSRKVFSFLAVTRN